MTNKKYKLQDEEGKTEQQGNNPIEQLLGNDNALNSRLSRVQKLLAGDIAETKEIAMTVNEQTNQFFEQEYSKTVSELNTEISTLKTKVKSMTELILELLPDDLEIDEQQLSDLGLTVIQEDEDKGENADEAVTVEADA